MSPLLFLFVRLKLNPLVIFCIGSFCLYQSGFFFFQEPFKVFSTLLSRRKRSQVKKISKTNHSEKKSKTDQIRYYIYQVRYDWHFKTDIGDKKGSKKDFFSEYNTKRTSHFFTILTYSKLQYWFDFFYDFEWNILHYIEISQGGKCCMYSLGEMTSYSKFV